HRDVGEQRHHQTGPHGGPPDRRDHRLVETDHVEHQIAGLAHYADPAFVVAHGFLDYVEAAAGGKSLALAAGQHNTHGGIAIDHRPDIGQVAVHLRPDRIQPRGVENQRQHAVLVGFAAEAGELVVIDRLRHFLGTPEDRGSIVLDEYSSR